MSTTNVVLGVLLLAAVIPAAVIDQRTGLIPDRLTAPAALVAIAAGTALNPGGEWARLLAGVVAFLVVFLIALARPGGMGVGDAKLLGVIGLFLGDAVAVAFFVAVLAGVIFGIGLAARGGVRAAGRTKIRFGPYLAFGGIVAAGVGHQLIHAWLHSH